MELSVNTNLSHYRIESKIGAGGMGEVYRAYDSRLDRAVALKVLSADLASDKERLQRFEREAKAASALNHPNIIIVHDIGSDADVRFIATELITGTTLRDRIRSGPMVLSEALNIARQTASALAAAHAAGILHRDIKPENIMLREDGIVKVLDFGLAKLTESAPVDAASEDPTRAILDTQPGMVIGTAAYMSPEQARGRPVDTRSDVFSLGIMMYELFAGRRPFEGEGQMDLISSILKDEPPPIRQFDPNLPRQLERIVQKSLRKDRDQRYQHVKDLEIDLEDLREELRFEAKLNQTTDQVIASPNTASLGQRLTLTESISATRRFTLLHAIAFVVVVVLGVGLLMYLRPGMGRTSPAAANLKIRELASWTSAPGELFSNASFSPDGKMIAFSSTKSSSKNIWVTQTASTEAIQVTNDEFSNKDPIWSPAGDEIAFYSQKGNVSDGKASAGIWRISALGGTPRSVGAVPDGSFELRRWTDSGKIYFQARSQLQSIGLSTGLIETVWTVDPAVGSVVWINISPDERTFSYAAVKDGLWHLFEVSSDTKAPREVASGPGDLDGIIWLADSSRYFYSSLDDGVRQIFSLTVGNAPVRLTNYEYDSVVVDAAADGKSLIVSSAKEDSDVWRVDVTSGAEAPVSRTANAELWPSVSPDGTRLAFQSIKNLNRGNNLFQSPIFVRSTDPKADKTTQLVDSGFLPVWSPDGTAIAFFRREAGKNVELLTANPNGGGARVLANSGIPLIGYSVSPYNFIQTGAFAWSPNSDRIAYVSDQGGSQNLWTVSTKDGSSAALTANTDKNVSVYCPVWSTSGDRIAYFRQTRDPGDPSKTVRSVGTVEVSSGLDKQLYSSLDNFRLIGWSSDDKGLVLAQSEKSSGLPPETLIQVVSLDKGTVTTAARLKNAYFYNLFLDRDRKYVGFAARDKSLDNLWLQPLTGGPPRKLTNNTDSGVNFSRLAWLQDGSAILFGKQTRFSLLSIVTNVD